MDNTSNAINNGSKPTSIGVVSTITTIADHRNNVTQVNSQTIDDFEPDPKWEMTTLEKASFEPSIHDQQEESVFTVLNQVTGDTQIEKVIDNIVELGGCQQFVLTLDQQAENLKRGKQIQVIDDEKTPEQKNLNLTGSESTNVNGSRNGDPEDIATDEGSEKNKLDCIVEKHDGQRVDEKRIGDEPIIDDEKSSFVSQPSFDFKTGEETDYIVEPTVSNTKTNEVLLDEPMCHELPETINDAVSDKVIESAKEISAEQMEVDEEKEVQNIEKDIADELSALVSREKQSNKDDRLLVVEDNLDDSKDCSPCETEGELVSKGFDLESSKASGSPLHQEPKVNESGSPALTIEISAESKSDEKIPSKSEDKLKEGEKEFPEVKIELDDSKPTKQVRKINDEIIDKKLTNEIAEPNESGKTTRSMRPRLSRRLTEQPTPIVESESKKSNKRSHEKDFTSCIEPSRKSIKITLRPPSSRVSIATSTPASKPPPPPASEPKRVSLVTNDDYLKKFKCHDCGYSTERLNNIVYHKKNSCQHFQKDWSKRVESYKSALVKSPKGNKGKRSSR